jgi:hypothetical protein
MLTIFKKSLKKKVNESIKIYKIFFLILSQYKKLSALPQTKILNNSY